jgi:nicotinamidase-related amidase
VAQFSIAFWPNFKLVITDAISLDYETVICTDACSAASTEVAAANIYDLEHMGIECISLKEIIPSAVS